VAAVVVEVLVPATLHPAIPRTVERASESLVLATCMGDLRGLQGYDFLVRGPQNLCTATTYDVTSRRKTTSP
jgi:hypothetical protein